MALAVRLLRHVRRRHILSPLSVASISTPLRSSPVQSDLPSSAPPHDLFLGGVPTRSFSWFSKSTNSGDNELSPYRSSEIVESDVEVDTTIEEATQLENVGGGGGSEVVTESSVWDFPVDLVTGFLDGYHDLTGLPWWFIIASSTVAMRVTLLPVLWLQMKKVSRIGQLFPLLPPPIPPPFSGRSWRKQYLFFDKQRKMLQSPSFLWNFAFVTVQLPTFILWMSTIRTMCLNHHPGFETGGLLWFQNLTDTPHGVMGCILPFIIAGLHNINVQLSFKPVQLDKVEGFYGLMLKYYKRYLDVLSIPFFLIGLLVPQGSLVYWATNGLFTLVQSLALRNEHLRMKLGIPDIKSQRAKSSHSLIEEMDQKVIESLSPDQLLDISLQELTAGKFESSIRLLKVSIEKDPDSPKALVALSKIMFAKASFQEAIEYAELAISKIQEEDPLLGLALYVAGLSHNCLGNSEAAITHLKRISNLSVPEKMMDKACYYQALTLLGSLLFREGKMSEAIVYLRTAATYDPGVNRFIKEYEEAMEQGKECEESMEQGKASCNEEMIEENKKSVGKL